MSRLFIVRRDEYEYRADTGTSASDEDGFAKQSG